VKKIVATVGVIAAVGFASAAWAADMPVKALVYKAAASYDPWTGFYAGGSVGARWSDVSWQSINTTVGAILPITGPNNPASLGNASFRVGGYAGYNWRIAPAWLVGLEADIAWGNNNKSVSPFPGTPAAGGILAGPNDIDTVKLGWDGSVRGRVGYLVNPTWLVYGTGGVAFQEIKTTSSCLPGGLCAIAVSGTSSTVKAGWTAGGGIETALPNHWLARVEYRYADFGHVSNDLPPAAFAGIHSEIRVKTQTALAGLAYKF
jgi:outer membrane immunogenic protein